MCQPQQILYKNYSYNIYRQNLAIYVDRKRSNIPFLGMELGFGIHNSLGVAPKRIIQMPHIYVQSITKESNETLDSYFD